MNFTQQLRSELEANWLGLFFLDHSKAKPKPTKEQISAAKGQTTKAHVKLWFHLSRQGTESEAEKLRLHVCP